MTEDQIEMCYHEASHAVVALHFDCEVVRIAAAFPRNNGCTYRGATPSQAATIAAAGIAWSGLFSPGVGGDALAIVRELKIESEHLRVQKAAVNNEIDRARAILEANATLLTAIASMLIEQGGIVEGGDVHLAVRMHELATLDELAKCG